MNKLNLILSILLVGLYSCGSGAACGYGGKPSAGRAAVTINGQVFKVSNGDTIVFYNAQVIVSYVTGWDTDCGIDYSEHDTLTTDTDGFFNHGEKAYDACEYGIRVSEGETTVLSDGYNDGLTLSGCPKDFDGKLFYIEN